MACSPVVAITGGPATPTRYRGAYQEVEDFTQFDPVTKLNLRVDDLARFPDLKWTGSIEIAPNNFVHAISKLGVRRG